MAEITIEGLRGLRLDFDKAVKQAHVGADRGLQAVGLEIVNEAKRNLTQNKSNTTGQLRASGKVQKDKDGIDAGFFSKEGESGYAAAVEYGRKAGKMPPVDMLMEWLRKRTTRSKALKSALIHIEGRRVRRTEAYTKDDLLRSAAWGLAKWIAKKGTQPHPFFAPAVKKYEDKAAEAVQNAIDKALP